MSKEARLILADAKNMVSSMPMPVLDGLDVPVGFRDGLLKMAKQQAHGNALLLASLRHGMAAALDQTVATLSKQIEESKKEVTTVLREELESAQKLVDQRFAEVNKKLDDAKAGTPSAEVMKRLEEMSQKIDSRDWITDAWNNPSNIHLRQIIAWILRTSVDPVNSFGMTPLINFAFFSGRPHTEENHLTVLNKPLIRMLLLHQDKFTPALQRGIQTQTEKTITPVFKCVQDTAEATRMVVGTFPVKPYAQAHGNCYVFRTRDLIRMLKEEKSYMERDQIVLPTNVNLEVISVIHPDGSLTLNKGAGIGDVKKARAIKLREMTGISVDALYKFASTMLKTVDPHKMLAYLAVRRYWDLPASKEYMEQASLFLVLVFSFNIFPGRSCDGHQDGASRRVWHGYAQCAVHDEHGLEDDRHGC